MTQVNVKKLRKLANAHKALIWYANTKFEGDDNEVPEHRVGFIAGETISSIDAKVIGL